MDSDSLELSTQDETPSVPPYSSLVEALPHGLTAESFAPHLYERICQALDALSHGQHDPSTLKIAVDHLLQHDSTEEGSLPPLLADELGQYTDLSKRLTEILHRFFNTPQSAAVGLDPLNEDHRKYIALLFLHELLAWHAFDRMRNPYEHGGNSIVNSKDMLEKIEPDGSEIFRVRAVTRCLILAISTYTTILGTLNLSGLALQSTGFDLPPELHEKLRYALSAVFGVGVSATIFHIKHLVDKFRDQEGKSLFKAFISAYRELLRRDPKLMWGFYVLYSVLALGVIDISTNVTGWVAQFGELKDHALQIHDVNQVVDKRQRDIKAPLTELPKLLSAQVDSDAQEVLRSENAGTSYSGAQGTGPLWHTKNFLFYEDPASLAYLSGNAPYQSSLLGVVQSSRLASDGSSYPEEVSLDILTAVNRANGLLDEIDQLQAQLKPSMTVEELQAVVDKIAGSPTSATMGILPELFELLNEDLIGELEQRSARYNETLVGIAEVAKRHGYSISEGEVERIEFEGIDVDTSPININRILFKGPIGLIKVLWEKVPKPIASLIILLCLCAGVGISHFDFALLSTKRFNLQALYKKDKDLIAERRRQMDRFLDSMSIVLARVFNKGPLSKAFKTVDVSPKVLRSLLDEIMELAMDKQRKRGFAAWVDPYWNLESYQRTELACEHDHRIDALQSLYTISDPPPSEVSELPGPPGQVPGALPQLVRKLLVRLTGVDLHEPDHIPGMSPRLYPGRDEILEKADRELHIKARADEEGRLGTLRLEVEGLEKAGRTLKPEELEARLSDLRDRVQSFTLAYPAEHIGVLNNLRVTYSDQVAAIQRTVKMSSSAPIEDPGVQALTIQNMLAEVQGISSSISGGAPTDITAVTGEMGQLRALLSALTRIETDLRSLRVLHENKNQETQVFDAIFQARGTISRRQNYLAGCITALEQQDRSAEAGEKLKRHKDIHEWQRTLNRSTPPEQKLDKLCALLVKLKYLNSVPQTGGALNALFIEAVENGLSRLEASLQESPPYSADERGPRIAKIHKALGEIRDILKAEKGLLQPSNPIP